MKHCLSCLIYITSSITSLSSVRGCYKLLKVFLLHKYLMSCFLLRQEFVFAHSSDSVNTDDIAEFLDDSIKGKVS